MPRTKGPEKAQIRLRIAKELVEFASGQGGAWLERVIAREKRIAEWRRAEALRNLAEADADLL
jgi:hypothetical protein